MEIAAYLPGIYPRSEQLVAATRDLDRGRTSAGSVDELFDDERRRLIELQREAGLDYLTDGMLRWQDIFRPLADAADGLEARTLVRWFDNNSFYRAPHVSAPPALDGRAGEIVDAGLPEPRAATLPSPYLFSRAAQAEGDRNELLRTLATRVLAPAVRALAEEGYALIHLHEPWLGFHGITEDAWPAFAEGIEAVRAAAPDALLVLHVPYGDAAPHAGRLLDLPVDAVGIDFVETDVAALPTPWRSGLVAGCIDARRSVLESAEGTAAFVREVADRLEPASLYLTPSSELELLGAEVAEGKVRLLGDATARVREALR